MDIAGSGKDSLQSRDPMQRFYAEYCASIAQHGGRKSFRENFRHGHSPLRSACKAYLDSLHEQARNKGNADEKTTEIENDVDNGAHDTSNECHDPLSVNEITADLVISIARKVKRDLKRTHTRDDANCAENKDEEKGKGEAQQPIHDRKRRKKDDMKEEVKTNHVQQNVSVHDIVGGVCSEAHAASNERNEKIDGKRRRHKKKERRKQIMNDRNNVLLIFDLNKVLLHRVPKSYGYKSSSSYQLRPHVHEFIRNISRMFHIAVWTSGKRKNVSKMYNEIFNGVETRFFWCQDKCLRQLYSKEARCYGGNVDEVDDFVSDDDRDDFESYEYYKPLEFVWHKYPEFNVKNTILIDDSVEKARYNPAFTSIHPPAFVGLNETEEKKSFQDEEIKTRARDEETNNEQCGGDVKTEQNDKELHLSFGLGSYLMKLAEACRSHRQKGSAAELDVQEYLRNMPYD